MRNSCCFALLLATVTLATAQSPTPSPAGESSQTTLLQATPEEKAKADAKRADIRALQKTLGLERLMGTMLEQLMSSQIENMRKMRPDIPPEFWERFEKEVRVQFKTEDLLELLVPIYERHYSHEDIRAMLTFFNSPAGQHFVQAGPEVQREAMEAGRRWGREVGVQIGMKIVKELRESGIEAGTPPQPAPNRSSPETKNKEQLAPDGPKAPK